mmetsp:Transcript_33865/g.54658  ORF Transcript_33865/g.54658 Transcript_33865/m.54658 type:complete len:88 (-) Transcript_33865:702-965(-)
MISSKCPTIMPFVTINVMKSQHMPLVGLGGSGATFPRIALVFWYRKPLTFEVNIVLAACCHLNTSQTHVHLEDTNREVTADDKILKR